MTDLGLSIGTQSGVEVAGLRAATKAFGGTLALAEATLELRAGEVLALLGENGAGKSTCVKLLAGVYRPDLGAVIIDDVVHHFGSPLDAQRAGIAVMHQHPGLFPDLSIVENLFIGRRGVGTSELSRRQEGERLLQLVGLDRQLSEPLSRLRVSEQQLVEVARALSLKAKVLIMDEPTAALSQREVDRLFGVVDELRRSGAAIMFVGHRMDEVYRLADRITVLRDGRVVGTELASELPRERAIQLMVGRTLSALYPERRTEPGQALLEVEGLARKGSFEPISFAVRAGEILGLGGLVGSGRTEIARVLFGIDRATAGSVRVGGIELEGGSPERAMDRGVAYVSEDRIGQSLVMDASILDNASLTVLRQVTKGAFLSRRKALDLVAPLLDRLRLRFATYDQPVSTLSGGNQQKVVLAKWLARSPQILILDEPTQGVDVQTKADVHAMIAELAARGLAIILISSELPELLGMCDRILVLREGHLAASLSKAEASQERVIRAATGTVSEPDAAPQTNIVALHPERHELAPKPAPQMWRRWLGARQLGLVAAIVAVGLPVSLINPRMLSAANLEALGMDAGLLMIVAAAQMLVLLTRNIDLSVAAVIGLSAYGAASMLHLHPEIGVVGGLAVALSVGLACGLVNGAIVTLGRVPAIVVTLGTMSIFRGLNSLWAGGKQISADQVPQEWLDLTSGQLLGVPTILIVAIATLSALGWFLRKTATGRELFAVGSNPDGANLIGIPSKWRVLLAFGLAGLLAGFTGALWASRYATVDARVAYGYELTVIASVVVGGVAIRGGAGSLIGVALGAVTLLAIQNGLTLVRVDPLWLQGVYGLVILVAVAIDAYVGRASNREGGK